MQVTTKNLSETKVQLKLEADEMQLDVARLQTQREFAKTVKVPGFRPGKAPLEMVEKAADPNLFQTEFLEHAINHIYLAALDKEKLRPVAQPTVKIVKFVPYETLEFEAEVEIVGEIKLPDYKKFSLAKPAVKVDDKDVDAVIEDLLTREAEKKDVERAAADGDEVTIDFTGTDAKTKEQISGADGKGYPLVLGSNTFIPGFEPNLVGLKPGENKTFTVTFPKDYGVKALQNRKVEFAVTAQKVREMSKAKLDDAFAAKVGPFKTVADLKDDIKRELLARKEADTEQQYNDDLVTKLAEKAKIAIPEVLVDEQLDRIEQDQRQNLMYRGQTWQEFLAAEGLNDKTYRDKNRPAAELRVKAGLMLSEISEQEGIEITREELGAQLQLLKGRYPDAQMQAELDKPETRRTIASRLLTEKTVAKLAEYAAKK